MNNETRYITSETIYVIFISAVLHHNNKKDITGNQQSAISKI